MKRQANRDLAALREDHDCFCENFAESGEIRSSRAKKGESKREGAKGMASEERLRSHRSKSGSREDQGQAPVLLAEMSIDGEGRLVVTVKTAWVSRAS
jgi:hypothetical protein